MRKEAFSFVGENDSNFNIKISPGEYADFVCAYSKNDVFLVFDLLSGYLRTDIKLCTCSEPKSKNQLNISSKNRNASLEMIREDKPIIGSIDNIDIKGSVNKMNRSCAQNLKAEYFFERRSKNAVFLLENHWVGVASQNECSIISLQNSFSYLYHVRCGIVNEQWFQIEKKLKNESSL